MRLWHEMERVLNEERDLLRQGRIADLPALAEQKVRLLGGLGAAPPPAPDHIRKLAEENARLLHAAGRGIRSALIRIETARTAGTTRTYDVHGRVQSLGDRSPARGTRV